MRSQWQPKLGGAPGEIVTELEEMAQALSIVLRTPIGSVPGRPFFGSRLHELVDEPLSEVRALAPRYVREAARENLPRHEVIDTVVEPRPDGRGGALVVSWRPMGSTAIQSTRVA